MSNHVQEHPFTYLWKTGSVPLQRMTYSWCNDHLSFSSPTLVGANIFTLSTPVKSQELGMQVMSLNWSGSLVPPGDVTKGDQR